MKLSFFLLLLGAFLVVAQSSSDEPEDPEDAKDSKCTKIFDKCYRTVQKNECPVGPTCICSMVGFEEFIEEANNCAFNQCAVSLTDTEYTAEKKKFRLKWAEYCQVEANIKLPIIAPPKGLPKPIVDESSTSSTTVSYRQLLSMLLFFLAFPLFQ
ncbi:hypothetical protein BJ508DRAFT_151960 [Ascobolus immersus RN42]|uniref:Extracellular membrane protein CFEM domain-containing protein n=1 Tax=Ascobolus immersus RN42 TaxID=1160509 RepID=A0A3N4HYC9_ASCIM|nr:hypothetical protein BJ508DRAFT_151960 [Ascobolus immersus RN42]